MKPISTFEPPAMSSDLLHADLPLWTSGDKLWPQHFHEEEDEGTVFGCEHRMTMGDWEYRQGESSNWIRLTNYGLMHCFIIERRAYQQPSLEGAEFRVSMIVELGTTGEGESKRELWALQSGISPGSDYMLLARRPGDADQFEVLQRECPSAMRRSGPAVDIGSTEYCAISSQRQLALLARRMAERPPLGTLKFMNEVE